MKKINDLKTTIFLQRNKTFFSAINIFFKIIKVQNNKKQFYQAIQFKKLYFKQYNKKQKGKVLYFMTEKQRREANSILDNFAKLLFYFISVAILLGKQSQTTTTNPVFLTTLSNFQVATWVLTASNPTTVSGISTQTTTVNYINLYLSIPNIGFGIDFINSNYQTTTSNVQLMYDITIAQRQQTNALIQLSRTANSIQQLSLNYIVCDSSFWLDIRHTSSVDLSSYTIYTSASSGPRTATIQLPYKTKSNSSNAVLVYNTVGLEMLRQSRLFSVGIVTAAKSLSTFNISITVGGNNRLKSIRICSYSYQAIANSIDPPYYIDTGFVNTFSGTFPDSSGLAISSYGTVYTGLLDWIIDDSNSVLDYSMGGTGISYALTTTSLTQTNTAYFWYRQQTCPQYTFLNTHLCYSCHYTCLTCVSVQATACLTCPSTRSYVAGNHSCECITNYIDVSVTLCVLLTCQDTCLTCANLNQCKTCDSALGRSLSGIDCVCKDYTIDVWSSMGSKLCFPCHFTCVTCSAPFTETSCLSCGATKDHRFYRASNNTCACNDKYFPSVIANNPVCSSCQYSCAKCATSTSCTECNSVKGRVTAANGIFCSCLSTFYDDLLNQQCITCNSKCLTCNSLGCLTCNAALNRQISLKQCICKDGFFDDGVNAACQACDYTCATCNGLTQCASCNSVVQRYMDISTGVNLCLCALRYYSVVGTQQCMFCSQNCVTCNGANQNNCLTCEAAKHRQLSVDKKCVCSKGYYQVISTQELCQACYYNCETCDNPTTCLTCSITNFRSKNVAGECVCIDGYYNNGNQLCSKCDYRCLTCGASSTCLTCDSTTRDTANLANCICKPGFWDDGISSACKPCLSQCATCLNGNSCQTCPLKKVLTSTKNCICMSKTYPPNCLDCNYKCQQCTNTAIQCTKCNGLAMRSLEPITKKCICYDGYFDDGTNQLCASCHYSCLTCTSYAACDTCPLNRFKDTNNLCSCVPQFFQNSANKKCLACHYSCKLCQTFSECTQCDSATNHRVFPSTGLTTLTPCLCDAGFYDNGISQLCYACDPKCSTCSNYATCLSCNAALKRYFVPLTSNCLCIDTYYQDPATFLCAICQYSCKTCLNAGACATCLVGRHQTTPSTGYCLCDTGTFDDPVTKICTLCSYPCVQCSGSSTSCTTCDATRNWLSPTLKCQCKIGTFQNGTACDSCLGQCSECANKISCTVCRLASNRNLDGSNLCPCVSGYHDQGSTLLVCLKCHYSCATCTNAQTCTTCFSGRLYVASSTCACPAQRFYDDGTNGACVPCHYSCLTCSSLATTCGSCSATSNRDLVSNKCECKVGYFQNNVQTCVKCHYSCSSCSTSGACTNCDTALKRLYDTGPLCACSVGFYDDGTNAQCQACHYSCSACLNSNIYCTACPINRVLDTTNHVCPCAVGLFNSGSAVCTSCLYSCKSCVNAGQCTDCPLATRDLQPSTKQCVCKNGFYNVNLQNQCLSCNPLCLTCSDFSVCLTCDTPNNLRSLLVNDCVCSNGYFDAWVSSSNTQPKCQLCHYSCQNCVSATQCSSCSVAAFRQYDVVSKLCSCKDGYYDDTINTQCLKCPFDCVTCSGPTTCLTCSAERTLTPGTLRCDCAASYYANATVCQLCSPECSTCTSLNYCTGCNGVRTLSASNTCICSIGQFMVVGTALCTLCQYSCQTCVSSLKCSTCSISNQRYLSGSYCKCNTGYFDDNTHQPCIQCHYTCKTCALAGQCLSCDSTLNRVFNVLTKLCQCKGGYFQDPSTKLCVQCAYTCVSCTAGNTCSSCNTLHNRQLNGVTFKCQCPQIGFYDDGVQSMCQSCDIKCQSCQTTPTTCTSCLSTNFRSLQGNACNCVGGYFDLGTQICSKCDYKCLTCSTSAANCLTCLSTSLRQTAPSCGCQSGFYDDGVNSLCKACDYRCLTCSDGTTCLTCDALKNRVYNSVTKTCDCSPVYYDDGGNALCVSCTYSCVTCSHPTLCLTCPPTRTYKNGICQCNIKYYDDFLSLQCQPCHYSCEKCTNSSECSSCSPLNFRFYDITSRHCSCIQRYYDNNIVAGQELCLKCESSCLTCTNSTHCLACPANTNKVINLTVSTYCSCLYGHYESVAAGLVIGESSKCLPCHYSCEKCAVSATACIQCEAAKNRILNAQSQCLCQQYYYDDGANELCIKCADGCVACWGESPNNCLQCDSATYFLNDQCYAVCPDYYQSTTNAVTSLKVCALCTPFCLQCSSSPTICQKCQATHRLFSFNSSSTLCIDHCPQFYYQDPLKQCHKCMAPCVRCTDKYVCVDCLFGYYLDKYCYKCHPYCYSCTNSTVFDCITCVNGYYLDNGLCRKLTCGQKQYVHSTSGCVNCSLSYPHSQTCDSLIVTSCQENYILQSKANANGTTSTVCKTCSDVPGYKISVLASNQFECIQICGDGIRINDLCDDGNTLNGDGCSQNCKIQSNWKCTASTSGSSSNNKSSCSLKVNPQVSILRTVKVNKENIIEVYIQLSIGLRLLRQNFILQFDNNQTTYQMNLEGLNSKYTQYKLSITYHTTIQGTKLNIKIVSPVPATSKTQSSHQESDDYRLLQSVQLNTPLQISLNMNLAIQIQTQPPATFVDPETRTLFSTWLVYLFLGYQIVCLLLVVWMVYKRIKLILIMVDLYLMMRVTYLLCTFGSYNVSELLPTAAKGIQPFVYQFGPTLQVLNGYSSFYEFNYTQLLFSSCIIQLSLILFLTMLKYLTSNKSTQNNSHYYLNALLYSVTVDLGLSCLSIFKQTKFQSYIGSYSWATAIIILILLVVFNFIYINQGKYHLYKNRTILPTKSFVTSEIDPKQKDISGNTLQVSEFTNNNINLNENSFSKDDQSSNNSERGYEMRKKKKKLNQPQMWSQNGTQILKSQQYSEKRPVKDRHNNKSKQDTDKNSMILFLLNSEQHLNLHDLLPTSDYTSAQSNKFNHSSQFFEQQQCRNKITLYHLPILNFIYPFVLSCVCSLMCTQKLLLTRSILMFVFTLAALVFLIWQRPQSIRKSVRNIKLITNYTAYLIITVVLIVSTSTKTLNSNQWIDIAILIIVLTLFAANIVFWVVNLKYSPQYKQHLIEIKNQSILERNQLSNEPRKKIYTNTDQKSFGIKNIFRKYPNQYNDASEQLKSSFDSQIHSVSEHNKKQSNVFQQDSSLDVEHNEQSNKRSEQAVLNINKINQRKNSKEIAVKPLVIQYDMYLNQKKVSQQDSRKNSKGNSNQIQKSTFIQKLNSENKNKQVGNLEDFSSADQEQDKNKVKVIDSSRFIQNNKKVSPTKVSSLAKLPKDNSLKKSEQNNKTNANNNNQKLIIIGNDEGQEVQGNKQKNKHYKYKNPPKSSLGHAKSKSKEKEPNSLNQKKFSRKVSVANQDKKDKKQSSKQQQQSLELRLLDKNLYQHTGNQNKTRTSDYADKQTNQAVDSRAKQTKLTHYTMKNNNTEMMKKQLELLRQQKPLYKRQSSSQEEEYLNVNNQTNLKHRAKISSNVFSNDLQSEEAENEVNDDLSDSDYLPDFPTGINNSNQFNQKLKRQALYDNKAISKAKKLKKPVTNSRLSQAKKPSQQKRSSLSPSRMSKMSVLPSKNQLADISSIRQQNDIYSQSSDLPVLENELGVYNKILIEHQKYKDKKVDKILIEKELENGKINGKRFENLNGDDNSFN